MSTLRCLIVDDEPLARQVLRNFLDTAPDVQIVGEANSAQKALEMLQQLAVDALFVDIKMPGLSGLSLVKSLPHPPAVVFVTAYPEHAVAGFDLEAVDYLVKPYSQARLLEAVNRIRKRVANQQPQPEFISLKADKRLHKVNFENLYYFQAASDFVKVFHSGKTLIVSDTLKNLEAQLPNPPFCRIHKSFLINVRHLEYVEGNQAMVNGEAIPIGAAYRELLTRLLKGSQGG